MLRAQGSTAFVQYTADAMHVEVSSSALELVLAVLDRGVDGVAGSPEHRAALVQIIGHAGKIVARIDSPPPPSCNRHKDCHQADLETEVRTGGKIKHAYHCSADDCEECFGC